MQSTYEHPLMSAQVALEEEMRVVGREQFWRAINDARANREEADTVYGRKLLQAAVLPVADALRAWVAQCEAKGRGRKASSLKYLTLLEPEVVAFIALRHTLDAISSPSSPLTAVAERIGRAVEDEVRFEHYKEAAPEDFKRTQKKIAEQAAPSRKYKKAVLRLMANRAGVGLRLWPKADCIQIGTRMLELIKAATGVIDIRLMSRDRDDRVYIVCATEQTEAWVREYCERAAAMAAVYWPTIIPPKRWTTPFNGGYWTKWSGGRRLIKTRNVAFLDDMAGLLPAHVYEAVNAVQETPWRINQPVLAVLKEVWERGLAIAGLPSSEDQPVPPKPHDIATNEEARKEWKRAAARVHNDNVRVRSKRLQVIKGIGLAEKFAKYERIYFPHCFDFRGRMYAIPPVLNPQGADWARGLLTFADGLPIEDEVAAGWLAIHGANCYGFDKASLEDRIGWVAEHESLILASAEDPLGCRWWAEADSPWQFLAFCFEWSSLKRDGYGFVSHLPVHLDGSCNGLQHYSAMLRDEVGGAAVNLIPQETPADIYQRVADVVVESLRRMAEPEAGAADEAGPLASSEERDMARKWLSVGVDRKITKRPVMTLPYGSTKYSCRGFVEDALREKLAGKPNPFAYVSPQGIQRDGFFEASQFLTPLVWDAIGQVVRAAQEAMGWLQKVAQLAAQENLPVSYRTPDGFYVQQAYREMRGLRVKTILDGEVVRLSIQEETETMDKRRMANGIAPNFVHSLDATALRMFVLLAKDNDLRAFSVVHDSFGTHAARVELMGACIRKAFVDLYEENDVLEQFRDAVLPILSDERRAQVPPLPAKGSLDLAGVAKSDFFFA